MYTLENDEAYFYVEDYKLHECFIDFYYSFKKELSYGY